MRTKVSLLTLAGLLIVASSASAQRATILRDVKTVQVNATVVPNPEKIKEDFAPNVVADSLRNALKMSNFEVGDAPMRAHIVLEEFTSGSTAKRVLVGFGAGRSTVAGRLVFSDAQGKELYSVPVKVRGNLLFSGYQGGNTQRRQATAAFDQKLIEEIARIK
jgi:hypothetical protein